MGWNYLKDKRRKVGLTLRMLNLDPIITQAIKDSGELPDGYAIRYIKLGYKASRSGHRVLQVWSYDPTDHPERGFHRMTVFWVIVPEDPEWIVETY